MKRLSMLLAHSMRAIIALTCLITVLVLYPPNPFVSARFLPDWIENENENEEGKIADGKESGKEAEEEEEENREAARWAMLRSSIQTGAITGDRLKPTAVARVNMAALAEQEKRKTPPSTTTGIAIQNPSPKEDDAPERNAPVEEGRTSTGTAPGVKAVRPLAPSPAPSASFEAEPDRAKVGTGTFTIPPDTMGAVGLDKVMVNVNNNYRVQDKATGAELSLVSIDTFWASTGATGVFDPRVQYDPYNNRWLVAAVSNAQTASSAVLVGISDSLDPQGTYTLFRFIVGCAPGAPGCNAAGEWGDYPMLGFNKNWVVVSWNPFTINTGAFIAGKVLVLDYPTLRTGTTNATLFTGASAAIGGFCLHPATTFSATEETLYLPTHIGSAGATYRLHRITGTPAAPVFNVDPANRTRTGGGWTQPGGDILSQQCIPGVGAPTQTCPATPRSIEAGDAFIRSNVVFRNGKIYYPQSIALPAGGITTSSRLAAQWTVLNTDGTVFDGGRVEDATATRTNGGKLYSYPSLSVNKNNDVLLGFSEFESDDYADAGYTFRAGTDPAGTMQDPIIFKEGEDYYSKTFSGTRNRWGDYSHTIVDPSNDLDLWTIQEYAKLRVGMTGQGTNDSRWGTWWAKLGLPSSCPTITGTVTGGGTICAGGPATVTVTVSGGTGPYTVILSDGGGMQTGAGPVFTFNVNPAVGNTVYTVVLGSQDANGCPIITSGSAIFTVNPSPPTPTITPGGPTTFCAGGSVTLTSSSATGNQWYLNGNPIGGATNQTYVATASGNYTVIVTAGGCSSAPSAATTVTVNPTPPTPTIMPSGSQTLCASGNVTLTSSSATGNQWYLNGNPIGGATNQTYVATAAGSYTVIVTANGCPSVPSAPTVISDNTPPVLSYNNATVTAGTTPTIAPATGPSDNGTITSIVLQSIVPNNGGLALNVNNLTGQVQVTSATLVGNYTVTIIATDNCNVATTASFTVNVTCPTITLTPATLPGGVLGTVYNQTVSAAPAGTTYSYAVTTNVLPPGLALNNTTGEITGTPTAAGNYTFTITATGWVGSSGSCTKAQSYNLLVTGTCATITVNPATLPGTTLGAAYNQTVTATGGTAPYTFAVTQGALPSGLTLDANTGALTGAATQGGTFSLRVTATGQGGCTGSRQYVISVTCGALAFNPPTLPNGTKNVAYNQAITVTPGTGHTFSVLLGSLPPGYTLSPAGMLSGITNQSGTWTFTVKALAGSCQGTKQYTLTIPNPPVAALVQMNDYDGDGKSDPALFTANGEWRIQRSSDQKSQTVLWGTAGDVPVGGDYDGDGRTDVAVFRPGNGTWYIQRSSDGGSLVNAWGLSTDVPVPGDYDGDGKTDIAVWRGAEGNWYILKSSNQQFEIAYWGLSLAPFNDVPVAGDYDGDGKTDVGVFRRASGMWYVRQSGNGNMLPKQWGMGTDVPVVNDYDGDGKVDLAVWRGVTGLWYIQGSATGATHATAWGAGFAPYNDQAVPGDYDGDGQADLAVWRAGDATWYLSLSGPDTASTMRVVRLGETGDRPVSAQQK